MHPKLKLIAIIVLTLFAAPLLAQTASTQATPAQAAPERHFGLKYDPAAEVRLKGTVANVEQVTGPKGELHIILLLKTDTGSFEVRVCPPKFLKEVEITFTTGETIEVTGSKVKDGERDVVLSREIVFGNNTLTLRDKKGEPVWMYLAK